MADAHEIDVPAGMVVVSKDDFFAVIGPLDVHPSDGSPNYRVWEMRGDRRVVGRSLPGWKNGGLPASLAPRVYMLTEGLARAAASKASA